MDDSTKNLIQNHIDTNDVCLFMKGTPDAPQCGFSMAVSNMLKILEVNYKGINVLESQPLREGIKEFSDWPTIPQIYVKGEFVGGCDIVKEMYENGELQKTFELKGINFKKKD
jgi:monothiol glutaredoxin